MSFSDSLINMGEFLYECYASYKSMDSSIYISWKYEKC